MRLAFPFAIIHSIVYTFFVVLLSATSYTATKLEAHSATQIMQMLGLTKAIYLTGVPVVVNIFRFFQSKKTDEWLLKQDYAEIYWQNFKNQIK